MKVFVTGGNGFLGSRTVHELIRRGHTVRCLLRKTSKTDRLAGLNYQTQFGDILDPVSLVAGAEGCDAIIHLACIASWVQIRAQADRLEAIAVEGTRNVLEAAKLHGTKRMVHVSSAAAVNASKTPQVFNEASPYELFDSGLRYSIVKFQGEQVVNAYVREHGLPVVTVNPGEIYGPNDTELVTASNLIEILRASPSVACVGGTSVTHIDDVAAGIVSALEKGRIGERYILGGENLTIAQLAQWVRRVAGKNPRTWTLPNWILIPICHGMSRLGLTPPVPLDILDYAVRYWFVDSSKARAELGYTTRSTEETFQDVVGWLKKSHSIA